MNKKVLVTGGSRGIGKSIVKAFCEKGYDVAFTYLNSAESAAEIASKYGCRAYRVDFSSVEDVKSFAEEFLKDFGCPDILVNNAGISHYGLFQDTTVSDYRNVFGINFESAFFLTKTLVPGMISRKSGAIINISSIWGQCGASCEVLYSASKAALIGFSKALAKELAPSGIAVNCVAPGAVDTDMMKHFTKEEKEEIALEIPSGRFTTPEEVADLVLFLAGSPSALTGQVFGINGGLLC